ncbi:uncharacterized protein FFB14_05784 [Fusarium fujikuroi]|nr:uncharacterized protein FFB14_05784 [Fusarium fujikuroi]
MTKEGRSLHRPRKRWQRLRSRTLKMFPYTNSKKCMNCDKNINRMLAMMNGNYMDIISIFKAAGKMLKDGTDRFQDAHKLGIVKALIKFGQRSEVLVNTHALTLDDII